MSKQEFFGESLESEAVATVPVTPSYSLPSRSNPIEALLSLITQEADFPQFARDFNTIPTVVSRIEYVDRMIFERFKTQAYFFNDVDQNKQFHQSLARIGLPTLCPYLKLEGANALTHEDCMLDGEVQVALCGGRADICTIYRQSGGAWPVPTSRQCTVDLNDLDDWWRGEGKYD